MNSEFYGKEKPKESFVFLIKETQSFYAMALKKNQKTPKQEILKAIKIKEEYKYENEK